MNWSVFPKYHPGNSLSINTLVYLTNMREKLPSERTQPSIPTAQARILGQQADPQTLANPHAHIKRPARLQPASCQKTCPMGRKESEDCHSVSVILQQNANPLPSITRWRSIIPLDSSWVTPQASSIKNRRNAQCSATQTAQNDKVSQSIVIATTFTKLPKDSYITRIIIS